MGAPRGKKRGLTPQEELQPCVCAGNVLPIEERTGLPHAPGKVCAQCREHGQGDDLKRQAGDHDVDARLQRARTVGGGGKRPAGGLQHQGKDVAADEDVDVGLGLEAGQMLAVHDDDAREAEVDGRREEAGRDGDGDEVPRRDVSVGATTSKRKGGGGLGDGSIN